MFDFIIDSEERKQMFTHAYNAIEELEAWDFLFSKDCCLGSAHPTLKALKAKMIEQGTPKELLVDSKFFFTIHNMKLLRKEGWEEYEKRYHHSFIQLFMIKQKQEQ